MAARKQLPSERPQDAKASDALEAPLLAELLAQRPTGMAAVPAGQLVLGRLQALPEPGQVACVDVSGLGRVTVSHGLVPWSQCPPGATVALCLLGPQGALLLGPVWQAPAAPAPAMPTLGLTVDGQRHVVEAAQEIELRCGEAAIVLTADGRIQLRGTYITSHASATQRLVGGSVHVN